ncbi:MAG TPA: TIM barrel protein [Armatimonadota bacterium]|nr:TIM barrel protein [Armatimonadota bacterium]
MATQYRFSFGPWNIHEGADPFGPTVRPSRSFVEKLDIAVKLGFQGIQFHDDDVVPADMPASQLEKGVAEVKKMLDDRGLSAEFVAPRLWEDPRTVDGPVTSNRKEERQYAIERSKRAVDIARMIGTKDIVWWPAREGTYIRESKNPQDSFSSMLEYANALLEYDRDIRILGEMKPNEPMDLMYLPTTGHFLALCYKTADPSRSGVLIESAHAILAGLDPSDEMAYALWHGKLWSVHLNDQNGLKYDQDKAFGTVDLRRAFNQVRVLEQAGYGRNGEWVGLDVKAMRTQPAEIAWKHLENSKEIFLALVEVARRVDPQEVQGYIDARDYEGLELLIVRQLMGLR